jgi:ubiquinone/menaquinone biosynthesis C-methylase UbiE
MEQFDKVASLYSRVRPTYPKKVYQEMVSLNQGNLFSFAVDIGCGSGQSTEGLLSISAHVIGIEPGDNLREKASLHYPHISFYKGSGEQTHLDDQVADLVTIATAFYWMDRDKALAEVNRILKPKGIFTAYRYLFPVVENEAANKIVQTHLSSYWDQYREDRLVRVDDSDQLMKESGYFSVIKTLKVNNVIPMSVGDFVGFLGSTSYVSRYLETLEPDAQVYLDALEEEFQPHATLGRLNVNFDIHMVCAKK